MYALSSFKPRIRSPLLLLPILLAFVFEEGVRIQNILTWFIDPNNQNVVISTTTTNGGGGGYSKVEALMISFPPLATTNSRRGNNRRAHVHQDVTTDGPWVVSRLGFDAASRGRRKGAFVANASSKLVDMNDLVESMGLKPVKSGSHNGDNNNKNSKKKKKKQNVNKTKNSTKEEKKQFISKTKTLSSSAQKSQDGTRKQSPSSNNNSTTKTSKEPPKQQQQQKSPPRTRGTTTLQQLPDIPLQTQLDYSRRGHASIRNLIPPEIIAEVYRDLKAYSQDKNHLAQKGEDGLPFLQFFNTWRDIPSIQRLTTSPLLCHAAATMLDLSSSSSEGNGGDEDEDGVKLRLYQDSVFIKRNKDGITPWHIDGRMMPFDTSHVISFWIPLHPIPSIDSGGTALLFINKSHSDFALPYWNGRGTEFGDSKDGKYNAYDHLAMRYGIDHEVGDDQIVDNNKGVIEHHMPMDVGDCTVHNGWTMHCANGNKHSGFARTRHAIAITYVDSYAEVREDIPGVGSNVQQRKRRGGGKNRSQQTSFLGDGEDSVSYAEWIGDVLPRTRFQHELVPDVWPSGKNTKRRS